MTLANRIKERMDALKITQDELADLSGLSQSAIHKLISGKSLSSRRMPQLAKALECNVYWLTEGKGSHESKPKIESNAQWLGDISPWDSDTTLDDDEVELPFFREVELSAGSGISEVHENHGLKLRFAKSTLKKQGVPPDKAACVVVSGNSMEPRLPNGSTVGINTAQTQIIDGKTYAVDHDGHLRIKTLYQMPGGLIRLRSFNREEWPDELVKPNEIRVLGQIFWSSVLWN